MNIKFLNKFLWKYKKLLIIGTSFIILSNLFALYPAEFVRKAFDTVIQYKNTTNTTTNISLILLKYSSLIIVFAILKGIFMYFMRQTIIVMSRKIEFDLKNEIGLDNENKKIEIIWDSVVEDVVGDTEPKNVKGIKIKNLKTNKIDEIKVDGLFIAIGHDPATSLFKEQLKMDKEGYLITKPDSTETNIPGVYAAGDVKDKTFRQAVTAAGMGCMAALEAEKYISSN